MRRLLAVLAAGALFAVALCAYVVSWPSEEIYESGFSEKPFYPYATYAISKSPYAIREMIESREADGDAVRLLMGSSELSIIDPMQSHPYRFFNSNDYAIDTISIGNAGYQSLYHTLEIGALDELNAVPDRKVVLIVSMQWFFRGGCSPVSFQNSFSWEAYGLAMANEDISSETRAAIMDRVAGYGVSSSDLRAAIGEGNPWEYLSYELGTFLREGSRRAELVESLDHCESRSMAKVGDASGDVDWAALMEFELKEAQECCTNNDWGIYDEYWANRIAPWLEAYNPDDYAPYYDWDNAELDDFKLFLRVCDETGVEPLIILAPAMGQYYDKCGYPADSRQAYYELIHSTCEEFGVSCIDYADHEYEKYFLRDIMHLGWIGWLYVNHDVMDFYLDSDVGNLPSKA